VVREAMMNCTDARCKHGIRSNEPTTNQIGSGEEHEAMTPRLNRLSQICALFDPSVLRLLRIRRERTYAWLCYGSLDVSQRVLFVFGTSAGGGWSQPPLSSAVIRLWSGLAYPAGRRTS